MRRISTVFVAFSERVQYTRRYFDILRLDCTYKTNKFDMSLLHCMGGDHHGNFFTIALYFLKNEVTSSYDQTIELLNETVYTLGGVSKWPSVIRTVYETGLLNVIDRRFPPQTKRVLCRWQIMRIFIHTVRLPLRLTNVGRTLKLLSNSLCQQRPAINTLIQLKSWKIILTLLIDFPSRHPQILHCI